MPLGEAAVVWSISMPALPKLDVSVRSVPASIQSQDASPQLPRAAVDTLVGADELDADQRGLGPAEVAPLRHAGHLVALQGDLPEEVVGLEEHQVAAEI